MIAATWDKPGLIKLAKENDFRFTDFDDLPSAQVIMKRLNEPRSNNADSAGTKTNGTDLRRSDIGTHG